MLVIAHRGASGEYPENTLLAFEKAIEQGADGIELDVQRHPDGTLLLLHDRFIDKHTVNQGHFSEHSSQAILEMSISHHQKIITLAQALSCIKGRCLVNIELKCDTSDADEMLTLLTQVKEAITYAVINDNFCDAQFVLSSFNHPLLKHAERVLPRIKAAALIAHLPLSITAVTEGLRLDSLNPSIDCLNNQFVAQCKKQGLAVWVYTVDQPFDIKQCQALNVDAIFTNFPQRTRQLLEKG